MGLGDLLFKLAKLTIKSYSDSDRKQPRGKPFVVQYNPESLSLRHESVYQGQQTQGAIINEHAWSYSPPSKLSVELVFDGTNVGYMGVELLSSPPTVGDRVHQFLDACYAIDDKTHEPSYLELSWNADLFGQDNVFKCRLESADVRYTSFNKDGSPLHATLSASFVKQLSPKLDAAQKNVSSPDVTHRRTVRAGDTLPQLCIEIYGAPSYYLRVAEANGLDDFRALEPGRELIFPPFERPEGAR